MLANANYQYLSRNNTDDIEEDVHLSYSACIKKNYYQSVMHATRKTNS